MNNAINDTTTTNVRLDDATGFPESGTVQIGSEKITYTGITFGASNDTLTGVTRGAFDTTAASHSNNAAVRLVNAIQIGTELILYTQVSSNNLTGVTRVAL